MKYYLLVLGLITGSLPLTIPAYGQEELGSYCLAGAQAITPARESFLQPVWSPDGKSIAFSSRGYSAIWAAGSDGSELTRIIQEPMSGFKFVWAPVGRSIFCRIKNAEGLKMLQVEMGGEKSAITDYQETLSAPQSSPDKISFEMGGKSLVWENHLLRGGGETGDPARGVLVRGGRIILLEQGRETAVSDDGDIYYLPVFSPDGQWLVYEGLASGIHLIRVEGGAHYSLGRGNHPAWSPDGRYLLYDLSRDDGERIVASDLYLIGVEAREPVRLTDTPAQIEQRPSWAPDGETITWDDRGRIWTGRVVKR